MIRVYDSLSRVVTTLEPRVPGHVRIYTCGVTPYDQSHLGHARPAVIWDVIRRHLARRGYVVTYVQNFTDIDDKIIRRAEETGETVAALAKRHIQEYDQMMAQLGVMPADWAPRVTDNIEDIILYIDQLIRQDKAYVADQDVYFRVRQDPDYGRLSGRSLEDMREGTRVDAPANKEYAGDFALWKGAHPGEPAWQSPWGWGRPGWHIECSAMSRRYLGERFDMHGGGMDLLFPHHENERAQSRAYLGDEPVSIWVHSGVITREGVKMSKSLNNGITLRELLTRYPGDVLRAYLLSVHYRSPLEFDERHIEEWAQALKRVERLWADVSAASSPSDQPPEEWADALIGFEDRFLAALDDDFNTPRAFAEVFDMVKAAHRAMEHRRTGVSGLVRRNLTLANQILGFLSSGHTETTSSDALVRALVDHRDAARGQRNFALADELRTILTEAGYEVSDGPDGTRLHYFGRSS